MKLELIESSPRKWRATTKSGIVVTFGHGRFNDAQVVELPNNYTGNPMNVAGELRELADWLRANAYDLAMTESVHERIYRERVQRGLSQWKLAKLAGVRLETLQALEQGRGTLSNAERVLSVLF